MRNFIFKKALVLTVMLSLLISLISYNCFSYAAADNPAPSFHSRSDASRYCKNQLLNRCTQISLTYITDNSDPNSICRMFIGDAFKDNGSNPTTLGDYIRYSLYNGYRLNYTSYQKDCLYYYTFNYKVSYKTTSSQNREFEKKLNKVMKSLKLADKSDYQKVKLIYDYICHNVKYDNTHSSDYYLKYSAYAALINKSAVCQGYAALFYRMCRKAHIPVRIVTGTSRNQAHAWNIVKVGKKYYNVDATWDAGCKQYSYFLKSNNDFDGHIRNAEYKSSGFNSKYWMSNSNFA